MADRRLLYRPCPEGGTGGPVVDARQGGVGLPTVGQRQGGSAGGRGEAASAQSARTRRCRIKN